MKHSFEVYLEKSLIFHSTKNWIFPLFEFEVFLKSGNFLIENLYVKDKVIGKAAAMLLVHFQIKHIHAKTLSRLGQEFLDLHRILYSYDKLIERIYCQTEVLLSDISDTKIAYSLLKSRAEKSEKAI